MLLVNHFGKLTAEEYEGSCQFGGKVSGHQQDFMNV